MSKTICLVNGDIRTGITNISGGTVIVRDDVIEDVVGRERFEKMTIPGDAEIIDMEGHIVCAGFIDTHIHGFGGYETSQANEEAVLQMSHLLPSHGVTSFCPTIYTQGKERFLKAVRSGVAAMGREDGARIAGMNLEGPFISREQLGAQEESGLKSVDLSLMEEIAEAGKGCISLMTVAPELKNMRDLALMCLRRGITLSAGHTNASYENMLEGMQAGILHSTHFFNAMRKIHHRDPGCVGAILIHPEISCEVIADGHHVHPALIKLLYRDKPVDKIILITDSLGPTGQKEGPLLANREEVYARDGLFYMKEDDTIAGSSLTMMKGVENLVSWGIPLDEAVMMATSNPAAVIGKAKTVGTLIPGKKADITSFSADFQTQFTMIDGKICYRRG